MVGGGLLHGQLSEHLILLLHCVRVLDQDSLALALDDLVGGHGDGHLGGSLTGCGGGAS